MGVKALSRDAEDREFIIPFPSIFNPPPEPSGPTTPSSGSARKTAAKYLPGQKKLPFERLDDAGLIQAELLARQFADEVLTPEAAAKIAETTTLAGYFNDVMRPQLVGKRKGSTLQNYVTALSQWERYSPRLDLPSWAGMPIKLITGRYIEAFFNAAAEYLAPSSIDQSWKKLRAILNHAKTLKAIDKVPKPGPIEQTDKQVITYSDQQIDGIYRALADHPDLQVSFVLAINAGLRPVDLFGLRVADLNLGDEPAVSFTARKTGKDQRVPLSPVTVAHVRRLPLGNSPFLFPGLGNPIAKEPEDSAAAIERNCVFKERLASVGIAHERPWKVCRATCNTRLEAIKTGVGEFVLGHSLKGVNAKHYNDRTEVVTATINAVPQPACFMQILDAIPQGI